MDNQLIIEKLREVARRVTDQSSLELVHVEIKGSNTNPTIRVFIDSPEGITHDDCSQTSAGISEILDNEDFISTSFVLEVSSPGIERGLYSLEDFKRFSGGLAKIKTRGAIDGQRNFRGRIAGVENETIICDDISSGRVEILFDDIAKANLEVDLAGELKKKGKKNS